jgi:hypothetical protein
MFTPFHSQNTGRFYPFDESEIASQKDIFTSAHGENGLDIIRKGIVDLGIVLYVDSGTALETAAYCNITKNNDIFSVEIIIICAN